MNRIMPISSAFSAVPVLYFDSQSLDPVLLESLEEIDGKDFHGDRICCASCRGKVTSTAAETSRQGSHIHFCTNPHGHSFRFACYSDAPGCSNSGPASFEYSWFSGYSWRLALCSRCSEHLGWLYEGENRFYGLILDRLVIETARD